MHFVFFNKTQSEHLSSISPAETESLVASRRRGAHRPDRRGAFRSSAARRPALARVAASVQQKNDVRATKGKGPTRASYGAFRPRGIVAGVLQESDVGAKREKRIREKKEREAMKQRLAEEKRRVRADNQEANRRLKLKDAMHAEQMSMNERHAALGSYIEEIVEGAPLAQVAAPAWAREATRHDEDLFALWEATLIKAEAARAAAAAGANPLRQVQNTLQGWEGAADNWKLDGVKAKERQRVFRAFNDDIWNRDPKSQMLARSGKRRRRKRGAPRPRARAKKEKGAAEAAKADGPKKGKKRRRVVDSDDSDEDDLSDDEEVGAEVEGRPGRARRTAARRGAAATAAQIAELDMTDDEDAESDGSGADFGEDELESSDDEDDDFAIGEIDDSSSADEEEVASKAKAAESAAQHQGATLVTTTAGRPGAIVEVDDSSSSSEEGGEDSDDGVMVMD